MKRALEKRRGQIERNRLIEELKLSNMLQQRRINELDALYEAGKSIGSTANFNWVDTSLANPAFTANNYLASVDALFDQRNW